MIAALADAKPAPAAAAAAGATGFSTGVWSITGDIRGYPLKDLCNLTVQANKIAGTCAAEGKTYDVTGTVDGESATFSHGGEYNGDALTLTYTGKLAADGSLTGSVDVDPMNASGTFSATKGEQK
jgi:hypothetical protein